MIELPIVYNIDINDDEVSIETKHLIENRTLLFDINNLNEIATLQLRDVVGYISDIKNDRAILKFIKEYEKYENELYDDFCILLYFNKNKEYVKATLTHINNLNKKIQRNIKLRALLKSIN